MAQFWFYATSKSYFMKQRLTSGYKTLAVILISLLASILTFAQEKSVDIDIDAKAPGQSGNFFASPWVWVVGGAIFILLLVALMRGGNKSN